MNHLMNCAKLGADAVDRLRKSNDEFTKTLLDIVRPVPINSCAIDDKTRVDFLDLSKWGLEVLKAANEDEIPIVRPVHMNDLPNPTTTGPQNTTREENENERNVNSN